MTAQTSTPENKSMFPYILIIVIILIYGILSFVHGRVFFPQDISIFQIPENEILRNLLGFIFSDTKIPQHLSFVLFFALISLAAIIWGELISCIFDRKNKGLITIVAGLSIVFNPFCLQFIFNGHLIPLFLSIGLGLVLFGTYQVFANNYKWLSVLTAGLLISIIGMDSLQSVALFALTFAIYLVWLMIFQKGERNRVIGILGLGIAWGILSILVLNTFESAEIFPFNPQSLVNDKFFSVIGLKSFLDTWGEFANSIIVSGLLLVLLVSPLAAFFVGENKMRWFLAGLLPLVLFGLAWTIQSDTTLRYQSLLYILFSLFIGVSISAIIDIVHRKVLSGVKQEGVRSFLLTISALFFFLLISLPTLKGELISSDLWVPNSLEYFQLRSYMTSNYQGERVWYINSNYSVDPRSRIKTNGLLPWAENIFGEKLITISDEEYAPLEIAAANLSDSFSTLLAAYDVGWILIDNAVVADSTEMKKSDNMSFLLGQFEEITQVEFGDTTGVLNLFKLAQEENYKSLDYSMELLSDAAYVDYPDGIGMLSTRGADVLFDFVEVDLRVRGSQIEVELNLNSPIIENKKLPLTTVGKPIYFKKPSGSYILAIGDNYLGPYSKATNPPKRMLSNVKVSDIENMRLYVISDSNKLNKGLRWANPEDCNNVGRIEYEQLKPSPYIAYKSDQDFCLREQFPTLEADASVLLYTQYTYDSNAEISHCFSKFGESSDCLNPGYDRVISNSSNEVTVFEITELRESPRRLNFNLRVSRSGAQRELKFELLSGSIEEYKLVEIGKVEVDFRTAIVKSLRFPTTENLMVRLSAFEDCSDDRNCLVADLDLKSYTGFAIFSMEISHDYQDSRFEYCLFNEAINRCMIRSEFENNQTTELGYVHKGSYQLYVYNLGKLDNTKSVYFNDLEIRGVNFNLLSFLTH